jgi:hypothetical protein
MIKPKQWRQLLAAIARVSEASYRRGFQQGHDTAMRREELAVQLEQWRFGVSLDWSPSPHDICKSTAVDRLLMEHAALQSTLRELTGGQ